MIRLENISKAYRTRTGRHWVFKDVGFTINRGEKIGILGRNGAGKSTLMDAIQLALFGKLARCGGRRSPPPG